MADNTAPINLLVLDDFPNACDDLDKACDEKEAFLAFVDMAFYRSLRDALTRHPIQTVHIIEALASPNISEFTFEAQRKPLLIYKKIAKC